MRIQRGLFKLHRSLQGADPPQALELPSLLLPVIHAEDAFGRRLEHVNDFDITNAAAGTGNATYAIVEPGFYEARATAGVRGALTTACNLRMKIVTAEGAQLIYCEEAFLEETVKGDHQFGPIRMWLDKDWEVQIANQTVVALNEHVQCCLVIYRLYDD